jgi:hypothetical protein
VLTWSSRSCSRVCSERLLSRASDARRGRHALARVDAELAVGSHDERSVSANPTRVRTSARCPTTSCANSAPPRSSRPRPPDPNPRSAPSRPMLPDDLHASGQLPQLPRLPRPDGGPPKTERPESLHPD